MRLLENTSEGLDEDREGPSELLSALETIDLSMKSGASIRATPGQILAITPEALGDIVRKAVADAIADYERSRGDLASGSPASPPATPASSWRTKLSRLQDAMGLDEIEFDDTVGATGVSALPQSDPAPASTTVTPSKSLTPEAAATVFFTFEPMPPVPPRLPREPRQD